MRRTIQLVITAAALTAAAGGQTLTCPVNPVPPGRDFHQQTIKAANFAFQDLKNSNFAGATLIAPFFGNANLTGANFEGTIIETDSSNPAASADFSFATLDKACFIRAQFNGLTYFTNASLTCADFSQTNVNNGNAIFGEGPLEIDRSNTNCRLAFRQSTMSCEFFTDWPYLDLSGANIHACVNQFDGRDFSNAKLASVDLTGAVLDATKFVGADLSHALLNRATLQNADLAHAVLEGTQLNFANLTGASLSSAHMANASLRQAHLKNVNLSNAELNGTDFTSSNFYGTNPGKCNTAPSPSQCDGPSSDGHEGFTCGCSAAYAAKMTGTIFTDAYLYGVDFSEAEGYGVEFSGAILVGSRFTGATLSNTSGKPSLLQRAFLQGATLDDALDDSPDLNEAFVDFRPGGNNMYILLDGTHHNQFTCSDCTPATGSDVCVYINYESPTKVPEPQSSPTLTCPDGFVGDCGAADPTGGNPHWKSPITKLDPSAGVPAAAYQYDATYMKAPANPKDICQGLPVQFFW